MIMIMAMIMIVIIIIIDFCTSTKCIYLSLVFTAIGELRRKMFEQSGKLFKGVPVVFRNSQTVKSATSTTGHVIKMDVPVTRGLLLRSLSICPVCPVRPVSS